MTEQFVQELHVEEPAVHYLTDTIADFLLNRGHAAKIGEIASQVGKRIGASAKLIRQTLTDCPQFVGEERRWNLSLRTLNHSPLEGALQRTLRMYGKPLSITTFSNELAVLNTRSPDYYQDMLPAFIAARPQAFFHTSDDRWGLIAWLLDMSAIDEEELLFRNFFTALADTQPLLDTVCAIKLEASMSYPEAALALLNTLDRPLSTRVLSYALWRVHGKQFDPLAFYLALLDDPRFHLLSGGEWERAEKLASVTASLQKLSALADISMEEEEAWEGPYTVTNEDLNEIFDFMVEHSRSQKLSDLIEAVLEYSKFSPRYEPAYQGLMVALLADPRFQLVGQQTWTLPVLVPQAVLQVPEALLPETIDSSLFSDPETDAELEDEGLENNLPLWVHDPRYEDFGGEHEVELSPELMNGESALGETRVPLLYDHHAMGTLKLRQADLSIFPTDTPLACVTMHGEQFDTFQIWINNEELLVHGLADWYQARQVPVGAVLIIRRGDEPDDYFISWDGAIDELIALPTERIDALLNLREPAETNQWSIYEIMRNTLAGHPEGSHFLTIWAEVNVIRRTPKRVIASNLSSYHCFVQVSNSERWRLDERKVEQGRKKTKKKFIIS